MPSLDSSRLSRFLGRPMKNLRLLVFLLTAISAIGFSMPGSHAEDRPNFLILISDDISYDDLGCYGSPNERTPRIDALAREGMLFTNAYLTASSCSPSRSSINTGRYPHNNGEASELHRPISWHLPSIAGELRGAGYHTALAGKNHMSWTKAPEGETPPTEPWVKIYGAKVEGNSGGHGEWITALEESPKDQPFFLWLAALDAHRAWDGDREWDEDAYGPKHDPTKVILPPALVDTPETREDFTSYLNEVTRYDHFVGKVADWLKEKGKFENTWLIIIADNGRPFPRAKTRIIDDGMQTYFVATGPGIAQPGSVSHSLISVIDIAPTFAEMAGIEKSETFQGRSMAPVFTDPTATIRPFAFSEHNWHDYEAHGRGVRDGRWLYIRNFRPALALQGPADSAKSPSFQALRAARDSSEPLPPIQADIFQAPRAEIELFDTEADPHQVSNLAGDPDYTAIEKKLGDVLARWMNETGDSVPDEISPDTFDRETGTALKGVTRNEAWKEPAGADRGADRINAEGL